MFFDPATNGGYLANTLRTIHRNNKDKIARKRRFPSEWHKSLSRNRQKEEELVEIDDDTKEKLQFLVNANCKTQHQVIKQKMIETFHVRRGKNIDILKMFPRFTDTLGLVRNNSFILQYVYWYLFFRWKRTLKHYFRNIYQIPFKRNIETIVKTC